MTGRTLRQNITVPTIRLALETSRPLDFDNSVGLRGFMGHKFSDDVILHNHDDKDLIYSYPRVQYKVIDGKALIMGLAEGAESLKHIPYIESVTIGCEDIKINGIDLSEKRSFFGILDVQQTYSLLTPWLALNEKNYEKYQKLGNWPKKKELLEKVLIGNIISMSKSLGYTVPEPIKANIGNMKEVQTKLKGTPMLGFLGAFSVNFEIPDYWGIGKSVSRGFGTIIQCR